MNDTILIDFGNESYKIMENSQNFDGIRKIYNVPKGEFDFNQCYDQIE